jgi:hypothetical protein
MPMKAWLCLHLLIIQQHFPSSHSDDCAAMSLRKRSLATLEGCFLSPDTAKASHDTTRFDDLDFENAIKANLDRGMSYSASVYSFLHQHCLPFQRFGPPRAISQHDQDGVTIQCLLKQTQTPLKKPRRANRMPAALSG